MGINKDKIGGVPSGLRMNIKIGVATHKAYWMPDSKVYLPIHAGAEGKESLGYQPDNEGENISSKNPNYCELTALYWLWKNCDADYLGLVHYRRHFTRREVHSSSDKIHQVLNEDDWMRLLEKCPIVVPDKRRYYIESNYSHYIHAHNKEGLKAAEHVIRTEYPQYAPAMEKVWNRSWAHMFNMFVMRKDFFDSICQFLFGVLENVEEQLNISEWSKSEARVYGYISELLLDVWLEKHGLEYLEQNVSFMEKQNWLKKGGSFLARKIFITKT